MTAATTSQILLYLTRAASNQKPSLNHPTQQFQISNPLQMQYQAPVIRELLAK
jgi:hypothetical protein